MRLAAKFGAILTMALAAATLAGCSGTTPEQQEPAPELGKVDLSWTIEGSKDPIKCLEFHATQIQFVFFSAPDLVAMTQVEQCDNFQVLSFLQSGGYSATATLLDSNSSPVSNTLRIDQVSVPGGAIGFQPSIDFPRSAMITGPF